MSCFDEEGYFTFLLRQLMSSLFWQLFLIHFALAVLYSFRKSVKDRLFWAI